MTRALSQDTAAETRAESTVNRAKSWRKSMSDHVAYALLVYTGLHIFVTMKAVKAGNGEVLPYLALVVLVAAIIPACRWFEKRWERRDGEAARDPARAPEFRRDITIIWAAAIGLPLLLTGAFKLAFALF